MNSINKNLMRDELSKLLDLPLFTITDDLQLRNVDGWDSVAWVSLIAFLIGELDCAIEIQELMAIQTVGDLWVLVETETVL